ncbi:MAG: hypothetical protein NTX81_05485, partial [Candidatus Bathyarchaeota archaeon]|nr:hypothetical protein [Candidatus Bathyarchaeota archaeon]
MLNPKAYYPAPRPRPVPVYYPRPPRPARQPLRIILLVLLFAGLLLTSIALIVQFIYRPPSINHTPVSTGVANSPVSLNATVFGGGSWVQNVTLHYNLVKNALWKTKSMTVTPNASNPYLAVIPGSEVTSSIAYYIEAVNALGASANTVGYLVQVKDFNMSAQVPGLVLSAGGGNTTTITVGSLGGFGSSVSLSMSGLPSGVTASFNPVSLSPPANGIVTSSLALSSTTSAPAGTYTAALSASSGNLTHTRSLNLKVNPPRDFDILITPTFADIRRGAAASYTVTLNAKNGYIGGITLSVSGLPTGIKYTFGTYHNKTGLGGTLQNVTLVVSTNLLSALSITPPYTLAVSATDGVLTHTATVTLVVRP